MTKQGIMLIGLSLLIIIAAIVLVVIPGPTAVAPTNNTPTTTPNTNATTTENPAAGIPDLIAVGSPVPGQTVTSPLIIVGSARGPWYFEASFPIEIKDAQGKVIAQGHGEAQSNWMTEDFVIFKATVTYPPQVKGSKGTLTLKNDNPSGEPERDKHVDIPIVF